MKKKTTIYLLYMNGSELNSKSNPLDGFENLNSSIRTELRFANRKQNCNSKLNYLTLVGK